MNTQHPLNRIEADLNWWQAKEERFAKVFSFGLEKNPALLKEKLHYFESVALRNKGATDPDERMALRLLKAERRRIEEQLYPKRFDRLLQRLFRLLFREPRAIRKENKQVQANNQALHRQVQRVGFTGISRQLAGRIKQGQQEFSIEVSHYINDKERVDNKLFFTRDSPGQYRFEGYESILHNELKPQEDRKQFFDMREGVLITASESYNLLSGRSVKAEGIWRQLDLTDKDVAGNYKIKEFNNDFGYSPYEALQHLPLKDIKTNLEVKQLVLDLEKGNRPLVSLIKEGKHESFYIEANPQFKSVNFYDENGKKVSINKATGNKTIETDKLVQKIQAKHEQTTGKKTGMRVI